MKKYITSNNLIFLSLLILISVGPILTYATEFLYISPVVQYSPYATGFKVEIFNHIKSMFLMTIATILLFTFFYQILIQKVQIKKTPLNGLILFFFTGIWVATALADYKHIALFGNNDRFEGAIAWSCYLLVFFIFTQSTFSRRKITLLLWATIPFLLVNVILGLCHFFGINVLQWGWMKSLIGFDGDTTINGSFWTTLYNPNFISGVGAMFFIGCLAYLLLAKKRKWLYFFLTVMSFVMILTSTSSSGFLTVFVLFPVVILVLWKYIPTKQTILWSSILLLTCTTLIFGLAMKNEKVYRETIGLFQKEAKALQVAVEERKQEQTTENLLPTVPPVGASFGTGRVYIWKETLKLVKEKPLFGYGFDTYPYEVNNNDPEKVKHIWGDVFIDKPHNWYLTILYGSGIIGLLGLGFILLWGSIQTYTQWKTKKGSTLTLPLFLAITAFCVQGIFNDSFVGSSILFWGVMGMCYQSFVQTKKTEA